MYGGHRLHPPRTALRSQSSVLACPGPRRHAGGCGRRAAVVPPLPTAIRRRIRWSNGRHWHRWRRPRSWRGVMSSDPLRMRPAAPPGRPTRSPLRFSGRLDRPRRVL